MFAGGFVQLDLLQHLVVPLEDLDRVPALLLFRHIVHGSFFDVGDRVLHRTGKGVHRHGLAVLCRIHRGFCRFHDAGAFQRGDLNHFAAEFARQLGGVDLVAVFGNNVHHVDGDDHRDAQLGQLGGQIQVALQVGAVDDVQHRVRTLVDQIVTRHHFFQRVRRERVDAGQVGDDNTVVLFQLTFFFLDRNAGPVTNKLVGTRQRVEQSSFTAVRVTRKGNSQIHLSFPHFHN